MKEKSISLSLLGGDEPPKGVEEDARALSTLSQNDFEVVVSDLLSDENLQELAFNREETESNLVESQSMDADEDRIHSVCNFLQWIVLNASQRDLIETQIEQDLDTLDIPEDRRGRIAAKIEEKRDGVRGVLYSNSKIDPAPTLKNLSWNLNNIESTTLVQGANQRRVLFKILLEDSEEREEIIFQADHKGLQELFSQLDDLRDSLSGGVQDLD